MPTRSDELLFHDLLNALTVITGQCQILELKACREANTRLTAIREAAIRMSLMIEKHRNTHQTHTAEKLAPCLSVKEKEATKAG
jgi:hypothetical protein